MILCFGLIGLSLGIIAYFNVGVFKLSFLADEEQRLMANGLKTGRRIVDEVVRNFVSSTGELTPVQSDEAQPFDFRVVPGLRYFELLDKDGRVLMRSGESADKLPGMEMIIERIRLEPVPTHLFLDTRVQEVGPLVFPYRERLPVIGAGGVDHISYEHFYPVFLVADSQGMSLDKMSPATFQAVIHLSFGIENTSKRLKLVTAGNVLLGLTFLLTTLMAIHLWSQHAIQRPLEGLVESMRQLETGPTGRELSSHNELANISKTLQHLALDRLKYQRELESLNSDLEAQVEGKTREMKEFFSLVTHDLRIPLAAVQGYCDLLKRKPDQLSERQLTFVKRIATANGHSLELVRNLLEAMKIEFGTLNPVMEDFDFLTLAEEVRNELNVDDSVPPVELDAQDTESEKIIVEADRTRIKRVLTNLLSNAQRHAEGTPNVTLRWKKIPRRGVRIQVVDEGPGIPTEECQRVFEKFSRAPQSMGNSTGLGLGLYIVGKILESHDRSIQLKSEVGKGTTFEFNLATKDKD